MIILSVRTDKPEAELALFNSSKKVDEIIWLAHRTLADSIHVKTKELLDRNKLSWQDIEGLICYKGPGSFTGLRIGLTVANTLAYAQSIPIIGASGENWQKVAINNLVKGNNDSVVTPIYGGEVKITKPKK
jgi:tRNA threonylcarbamoyladenosine biosynthesis protein TsaB